MTFSIEGLGVSFTGLGELGVGEGIEEKVGLLATRVRGGRCPAGFGDPGDPGYVNGK